MAVNIKVQVKSIGADKNVCHGWENLDFITVFPTIFFGNLPKHNRMDSRRLSSGTGRADVYALTVARST